MKLCVFLIFGIFNAVPADGRKAISISKSSCNNIHRRGDLMFEENFNEFNHSLWKYEVNMNGGGNKEFQIYSNYEENAYVKDGYMWIKPSLTVDTIFKGKEEKLYSGTLTLEGCTDDPEDGTCEHEASDRNIHPPTVSARLRTKGSFSFTYGKIEVRAKMPMGDWMWPAVWMLPGESKYGGWPKSGEIDIVEVRGNRNLEAEGGQIGSEQAEITLHYSPTEGEDNFRNAYVDKNTEPGEGYDRDFHLYQIEWTPEFIKFAIDNEELKEIRPSDDGFFGLGQFDNNIPNPWVNSENFKMAPFDQNFHFIINVAVGGDFFPSNTSPEKPWGTETPFLDFINNKEQWVNTGESETNAAMAIDYIKCEKSFCPFQY